MYMIRLPYSFSDYDRQLLTLFYQPLVGAEGISLFLTLWADGEVKEDEKWSHYQLMNVLGLSIGKVFQARIALEAIGLLRTWQKTEEETRVFYYELMAPLDAESFLKDPLLSMFLLNKIGENAYKQLRNRFIQSAKWNDGFKDVSRSFMDVFKPSTKNGQPISQEEEYESKYRAPSLPFYYEEFDFALLQEGLSEQLVPKSAMTIQAKEVIAKLAFLYNLSPVEMQKVVILALDDDMQLSDARLKKACADYYKLTVSKKAPIIQNVTTTKKSIPDKGKPLSKEEELIYYLENTSPVTVLKDIANGKEPILADVQLANHLVTHYSMPIGVVNVLLQYVLLRTDMKLTKNYAEKIASHWMRKDVKTAKQAMELARNEHEQYIKWKNEGSKQKTTYTKKPTREEKVPDWFYKKDGETKKSSATNNGALNIDEEREKLMAELGITKR